MGRPRVHAAVIALILALGTLMLAPGVSQAHVRAKYRNDFKARLADITQQALGWQDDLHTFRETLSVWHDQEQAIADDPDEHEALLGLEAQCQRFSDTYSPLCLNWKHQFDIPVLRYKAKYKLYFSTAREQSKFKKLCGELDHGAGGSVIFLGHIKLCEAYGELAVDPPRFDLYDQLLGESLQAEGDGSHEFDAARKALKGML
jgi:hypothetical protein